VPAYIGARQHLVKGLAMTATGAQKRASRTGAGGFTLLELLVVIAIIGLLAGMVAPRYFDQVSKSNANIARAQIELLSKALDQYRLEVGSFPSTEQGLAALDTRPQNLEKWAGPYLKKAVPLDPWERPYIYVAPGEHSDYDLSSLGSDGQPGGSGEALDLGNWQR
jgi:general secretion pathway protein G